MSMFVQIRSTLGKCGEPMTMDQLAEANGWDAEDRRKAYVKLAQMKARKEADSKVEEGKVCYWLVDSYVMKPGRKPGPQIHVGQKDKTPKPESVANNILARGQQQTPSETKPEVSRWIAPKPTKRRTTPPAPLRQLASSMQAAIDESSAALRSDVESIVQDIETRRQAKPDAMNLGKRFDVVAEDIETLVADALDANQDRELIKALFAANNAINRAARLYTRAS